MAAKKKAKKSTKPEPKKESQKETKKEETKKPEPKNSLKKHLYLTTIISLILGGIIGFLIAGVSTEEITFLVKESCEISPESLFGKSCEVSEECLGRLEVCSVSLKRCMTTTAQVDKSDPRNAVIPTTQEDCEENGGFWKIEMIPQE